MGLPAINGSVSGAVILTGTLSGALLRNSLTALPEAYGQSEARSRYQHIFITISNRVHLVELMSFLPCYYQVACTGSLGYV